jgi:glutathionyl-hydroquinone reductase
VSGFKPNQIKRSAARIVSNRKERIIKMTKTEFEEANRKIAEETGEEYKKIENGAVRVYQKINDGVVNGYKKIENGVVNGYKKIQDAFVDRYLTREGESVEEAEQRLQEKQNQE